LAALRSSHILANYYQPLILALGFYESQLNKECNMGFFSNLFSRGFDDPKPMTNNQLISAIAGQANWLDKMIKSPFQSQQSPSIINLALKRRNYIAQLCQEVILRSNQDKGDTYPGATKPINVFSETAEYAKQLESSGVIEKSANVQAVNKILFANNGVTYLADWTVE